MPPGRILARRAGGLPGKESAEVVRLVREAWGSLGINAPVIAIERWLVRWPGWLEYAVHASPATRSRLIRRHRPTESRSPVYLPDGELRGSWVFRLDRQLGRARRVAIFEDATNAGPGSLGLRTVNASDARTSISTSVPIPHPSLAATGAGRGSNTEEPRPRSRRTRAINVLRRG